MATPKKPLPDRVKSYFTDMIADILVIYGEKGFAPFKRPLTIAAPSLLLLYVAVYSPMSGKLSSTERKIRSMSDIAQYAEQYEGSKMRIRGLQRNLPLFKDKAEWLSYLINDSARKVGVPINAISAQREGDMGSYLVVSREVSTKTTYNKLGEWMAAIENSPIFVRITEFNMAKDNADPGMIKVTVVVSTVFPRPGGGGGG